MLLILSLLPQLLPKVHFGGLLLLLLHRLIRGLICLAVLCLILLMLLRFLPYVALTDVCITGKGTCTVEVRLRFLTSSLLQRMGESSLVLLRLWLLIDQRLIDFGRVQNVSWNHPIVAYVPTTRIRLPIEDCGMRHVLSLRLMLMLLQCQRGLGLLV